MQNLNYARASFFTRFFAYLLDEFLLNLVLIIVGAPLFIAYFLAGDVLSREVLFQYSLFAIILYVVKKAYFVGMTYAGGRTLGKMALGLVVVSTDGEKLTFLDVLFRETIGRFLSGILYIGYLMALGREHRALHDMLCDTAVCYMGLVRETHPPQKPFEMPQAQPEESAEQDAAKQQDPQERSQSPKELWDAFLHDDEERDGK